MFFGIQGCAHFAKNQQDKQGLAKTKVPMDKGDNEESSLKDIKEVLSLFPEFAKKWQGKQDLAKARALMFKGNYEASLKYNKEVLRQFPRTLGDQALFQMGLNYAHPENPNPDNQKSIECFQSIIEKFPKSSIRDEAGIWILFLQKTIENNKRFDNLQRQKENLKDQIEKLKKIDLGIEDKKRIDLPK
jgi:tetratricopeptide (TPR) repeat protein